MILHEAAAKHASTNATEAAPWWGVPVIAGGFLIVGGLLTFLANYVVKSRELERADRARWDDEVLETATLLMRDAQRISNMSLKDGPDFVPSSDRLSEYQATLRRLEERFLKLELIASDDVAVTAIRLLQAASQRATPGRAQLDNAWLVHTLHELDDPKPVSIRSAVTNFRSAVRMDLRSKGSRSSA